MTAPNEEKIKAGDTVKLRISAEISYPFGWKKWRGMTGKILGNPIGNSVFVEFPGARNKVAVLISSLQKA